MVVGDAAAVTEEAVARDGRGTTTDGARVG